MLPVVLQRALFNLLVHVNNWKKKDCYNEIWKYCVAGLCIDDLIV